MKIRLEDFWGRNIEHDGFILKAKDAYESARNIEDILVRTAGWFRAPKPLHYLELRKQYKALVPGMETHYPGVVDLIIQPEILKQLGFPVDGNGMVHYPV